MYSLNTLTLKCYIVFYPGYGFVDVCSPIDAQRALHSLQQNGVAALFAKVCNVYNHYVVYCVFLCLPFKYEVCILNLLGGQN